MSNYEWEHNCAVVDRLYYYEYIIKGTTLTALVLTCKDLWFIRRNWYADRAYKRLPVYLALWAGINLFSGWFLIWPLTSEEIRRQMVKRQAIGKFNYSLQMLDLEEDRKEWADELEQQKKATQGFASPVKSGNH